MKKISLHFIFLVVLLTVALIASISSVNAQTSFESDRAAKALVSKALKHYGSAKIEGDKVVFKKGRYVGFLVSDIDSKKALEVVTERALSQPDLIHRSRVKFRLNVNQVTQCPWYKGEVFSSQYKGKHYTLLVCKR